MLINLEIILLIINKFFSKVVLETLFLVQNMCSGFKQLVCVFLCGQVGQQVLLGLKSQYGHISFKQNVNLILEELESLSSQIRYAAMWPAYYYIY